MFQVGDRIQVDKGLGHITTAKILEVEFRQGTYICKVWDESRNRENVFAWHIYQDEISVKKIKEK